jgi:DNA-binding MarR family transcriptional regulator
MQEGYATRDDRRARLLDALDALEALPRALQRRDGLWPAGKVRSQMGLSEGAATRALAEGVEAGVIERVRRGYYRRPVG